ncbi:unnamed protein product, partial [Ectocarpus sp. 12 AP-2014]
WRRSCPKQGGCLRRATPPWWSLRGTTSGSRRLWPRVPHRGQLSAELLSADAVAADQAAAAAAAAAAAVAAAAVAAASTGAGPTAAAAGSEGGRRHRRRWCHGSCQPCSVHRSPGDSGRPGG